MDDDTPDLRARLRGQILACGWEALAPHHARGALFVAAPDLDLVEVAVALAEDRRDRIEAWLTVGRLGRPADALVQGWQAASPRFQFAIVQPFVVAQPLLGGAA